MEQPTDAKKTLKHKMKSKLKKAKNSIKRSFSRSSSSLRQKSRTSLDLGERDADQQSSAGTEPRVESLPQQQAPPEKAPPPPEVKLAAPRQEEQENVAQNKAPKVEPPMSPPQTFTAEGKVSRRKPAMPKTTTPESKAFADAVTAGVKEVLHADSADQSSQHVHPPPLGPEAVEHDSATKRPRVAEDATPKAALAMPPLTPPLAAPALSDARPALASSVAKEVTDKAFTSVAAKDVTDKAFNSVAAKDVTDKAFNSVAAKDVTDKAFNSVAAKDVTDKAFNSVAAKDVTDKAFNSVAAKDVTDKAFTSVAAKDVTDKAFTSVAAKDVTEKAFASVAAKDVTDKAFASVAAKELTEAAFASVAAKDVSEQEVTPAVVTPKKSFAAAADPHAHTHSPKMTDKVSEKVSGFKLNPDAKEFVMPSFASHAEAPLPTPPKPAAPKAAPRTPPRNKGATPTKGAAGSPSKSKSAEKRAKKRDRGRGKQSGKQAGGAAPATPPGFAPRTASAADPEPAHKRAKHPGDMGITDVIKHNAMGVTDVPAGTPLAITPLRGTRPATAAVAPGAVHLAVDFVGMGLTDVIKLGVDARMGLTDIIRGAPLAADAPPLEPTASVYDAAADTAPEAVPQVDGADLDLTVQGRSLPAGTVTAPAGLVPKPTTAQPEPLPTVQPAAKSARAPCAPSSGGKKSKGKGKAMPVAAAIAVATMGLLKLTIGRKS